MATDHLTPVNKKPPVWAGGLGVTTFLFPD